MVDVDFRRRAVGKAQGTAIKFTDINGIGPKTREKIKRAEPGIDAPRDIQDMSADELSDKAGISRTRAATAIEGAGGNPNISKRNTTGSVSAAGIKTRQGDFRVGVGEMDKARARNDARARSKEAVRVDERRRAPITTDYDKWKDNPGRWDFPGVDTPTQEPSLLPKDLKASRPDTAEFDEQGQAEFDEQQQEVFPRVTSSPSGQNNILETGEERILASDVTRGSPEERVPGLAPQDFEVEPETPGRDPIMGRRPSATVLPEDVFQSLGSGGPPEEVLEQQGFEVFGGGTRENETLF